MAITHSYVDYGAGSDATGDGSIGTPWKTLQWAFDHLVRNATDGNQVNLKAGTAHVNAAALDLTTFIAGGALSNTAPLTVRGYTATANDGGFGEINCNGATMWATTSQVDYVVMVNLEIHTFGDNHGVQGDNGAALIACRVHKGTSTPSGKYLVSGITFVFGNYIYGSGTGAARGISASSYIAYNYVVMDAGTSERGIDGGQLALGNIVVIQGTAALGAFSGGPYVCTNNIAYSTVACTGYGFGGFTTVVQACRNNIAVGFSGVGGRGIAGANIRELGYNAFYNNAASNSFTDQIFIDLTANDVTLAADPFVDAANGDFSLTAAAKTALRGVGWPGAYLGAHANTDGHITIGAVQYGEAEAGGGGGRRPWLRMHGG